MALGAGTCITLVPYFLIRLFRQKNNLSFMFDLLAYSDNRFRSILTGDSKKRMKQFNERMLKFLKPMSQFFAMEVSLTVIVIGVIVPIMVEGVTVTNALYWSLWILPNLVHAYYLGTDSIYVFGAIWYLPKYHLDAQTDMLINKMEQFAKQTQLRDMEIYQFDIAFKRLVTRIKQFDQLSRDLISSSRLTMSYSIGFMIVATT